MVLSLASAASAGVAWFDDFDSYADQAAFDAAYTQIYPADPLLLDQGMGYSGTQSANPLGPNVNYTRRVYQNFGAELQGTDADPLVLEFMMHMNDAGDWWTREYIEIRGYAGAGYGDGDLEELIAFGCTSSGVDTTLYNARTLGGGWVNTTVPKVADWVKMTMVISTSAYDFYVDDVLGASAARSTAYTMDCIVIGSGLSSRVDVHFDGVPEPAGLSLLGLGGLALLRRRR
jgi:hypothetical protein